MLRSIYLKTLRDYRVAIFGWGLGIGLLMYYVLVAIPEVFKSEAAKQALVALAASFAWIAEPVKVGTPGGYATFKYGFTILVMAVWPLLVGSRTLRGEEERGSLDVLLSVPRGRPAVALQKIAALWTALVGMGALVGLLTFAGGQQVKAGFTFTDALLFGLNLALICGFFGGVALLISQFTRSAGAAAGATGAVLLVSIVLDMIHRVLPSGEWLSRISPVYYYNLSKPIVPGYGANAGALLVLVALNALLVAGAVALFVRRDLGAPVALPAWLQLPQRTPTPAKALPVGAWSLRSLYARSLATVAPPTFWWTVGIAGFAGWIVVIAKQTQANLQTLAQSSPFLAELLGKVGGGDPAANATLLSFFFVFLPLLLMAFAVTQASRWAADEETGRQELVLATPQSRQTVVLTRFAAVATATVFIGVLTLLVSAIAANGSGLTLPGGNLAAATLGMIPLGLLVAALGYLFAGWVRAAVDTGLLSFLLVLWFFISFVGPELKLPDGALRLSVFYYYGTPLLHGLAVWDTVGILAVGALALVLATVRFARKDIGR